MNAVLKIKKIFYLVCSLFFILLSFNSSADNIETILQNLDRIEKDIQDLQKQVYRQKNISSNDTDISFDNNIAAFDLRVREIETQVKQLTDYVEEYVFKIDELNERINDIVLQQSQNLLTNNDNIQKQDEQKNSQSEDKEESQTLGSLTISGEDLGEKTLNEEVINILPEGNPDEQYQYAFDLLRSQKLEEAKLALEEFINKNDAHILAGSANYWIGEIIFLQGNYKEAALVFAEGYQKYPDSKKIPDTLFRLGVSLKKIGKESQACITLNELISKFPNSKLIKKANLELDSSSC